MELMPVVVIVLLVVGVVLLAVRGMRGPGPRPRHGTWETARPAASRVRLDLAAEDPEHPAVQRLVADAARQALQADPELEEVEVLDRDGGLLGRVVRPGPLPPAVAVPEELHEPRIPRDHTPRPVGDAPRHRARPRVGPDGEAEVDVTVANRPLAEQFDLPDAVRQRVQEPDRAIDVVRAVLEAAGRPVRTERGVAVTGDTAITVVGATTGAVGDELGRAFMGIQATGAARGLIIRLGYVDPALIRPREAAAPHVRHVTADGLQRMADAVEAGADPVAFAAGPVVLR